MGYFGRGSSAEILVIFFFWPVFQEGVSFKDISIFKSVGHFVQRSGTILAILVVNITANICGIFFKKNRPALQDPMVFKDFFPFRAPCADPESFVGGGGVSNFDVFFG